MGEATAGGVEDGEADHGKDHGHDPGSGIGVLEPKQSRNQTWIGVEGSRGSSRNRPPINRIMGQSEALADVA